MSDYFKENHKKERKRSRHWDNTETEILISKWSEDDVQERLKTFTRTKNIWDEISEYLQAAGYIDRDGLACKVRIHNIYTSYKTFLERKEKATDSRSIPKKPAWFDQLHAILLCKDTTFSDRLANSSCNLSNYSFMKGKQSSPAFKITTSSNSNSAEKCETALEPTDNDTASNSIDGDANDNDADDSHDDGCDDKMNNESAKRDISSVARTSTTSHYLKRKNPLNFPPRNTRKSAIDSLLIKKSYHNNHNLVDKINTRMTVEKSFAETSNINSQGTILSDEIVLKIRKDGEPLFIEIDLPSASKTYDKLVSIIKDEYGLAKNVTFVLKKLPDILVRNDKDVRRLKDGQELEFTV